MIILRELFKKNKIPIWFMRQAGRYLPEYKIIRASTKKFLDFCYNPDLASEVTIQPLKRFDLDAAIIFSDILVIPDSLGFKVDFEEKIGPVVEQVTNFNKIEDFDIEDLKKRLNPVYDAIRLTKGKLHKDKKLIGFAGAPWTIATYMIEGQSSKNFKLVKNIAYNDSKNFTKLIKTLVESISVHLIEQIKAGADIIKIFDSWAGILDYNNFKEWVIKPTSQIVSNVRAIYPNIPIIGFPKGANFSYTEYCEKTNIDIISLDSNIPREWANNKINSNFILQGNLDPIYLFTNNKEELKKEVTSIIKTFVERGFIFNLGHGVMPETPIENIEFVIDIVRKYE